MSIQQRHSAFLPVLVVLGLVCVLFVSQCFYIVRPGHVAIHLRLGNIVGVSSESGLAFKLPLVDSVEIFDMRVQREEVETKSLSKDLQSVSMGIVINYRLGDVLELYRTIGRDFVSIIINPFVQESMKAVVAKFDAESLIQKRHEAKDLVISDLGTRLAAKNIQLVDFNFTHLDFSPEFIHSVEAKQIAEQDAKRAENVTKQVREEALQTRARAEAEAFSLQVKRQSVTPELIRLKEVETRLKAIEKWDGQLPRMTGSTIPFISTEKGLL